jgi:hypothetical protein
MIQLRVAETCAIMAKYAQEVITVLKAVAIQAMSHAVSVVAHA